MAEGLAFVRYRWAHKLRRDVPHDLCSRDHFAEFSPIESAEEGLSLRGKGAIETTLNLPRI